jgi:hypothetical protein
MQVNITFSFDAQAFDLDKSATLGVAIRDTIETLRSCVGGAPVKVSTSETSEDPPKRKRGRPRKNPEDGEPRRGVPKKPGRPRKQPEEIESADELESLFDDTETGADEDDPVTLDRIKAAIKCGLKEGKQSEVVRIVQSAGASNLAALHESKYDEVFDALNGILPDGWEG